MGVFLSASSSISEGVKLHGVGIGSRLAGVA